MQAPTNYQLWTRPFFRQSWAQIACPKARVGSCACTVLYITEGRSVWEGRRIQGKRGGGKTRGTLIGSRNKKDHAEARRVWNRAFTTPAVKKYEPIVIRRAAQLVEELRKRCRAAERDGKGLAEANLSEWLSYFS